MKLWNILCVTILAVLLVGLTSCAKDETVEAAPPPSPNAQPEPAISDKPTPGSLGMEGGGAADTGQPVAQPGAGQ